MYVLNSMDPEGSIHYPIEMQGMRIKNIFDGELVQDFSLKADGSKSDNRIPYYLIFDGLVVNGENVMHLNFRHRLSKAHEYVMRTYSIYRMLRE